MEKRGVVDTNTPDVEERLTKSAKTVLASDKVAILDSDTTKVLADTARAAMQKRPE